MIRFMLLGQAKDVFAELAFMLKLQIAIGHVLIRYQPELTDNSQN